MASRQRFRRFELAEPPTLQASVPELGAISQPTAISQSVSTLPDGISFLNAMMPVPTPRPAASTNPTPISTPTDEADPYLRIRVDPIQRLSRNFPLVGKRSRQNSYVPPTPVREPSIPVLPAQNLDRSVNIDVKVYVNPSGKVDYSEVLSNVTAQNRDLAAAAVFAARRCEFVPAREGSEAVSGEVILHYQFGPANRASGDADMAVR
jgi:hypothetical protein